MADLQTEALILGGGPAGQMMAAMMREYAPDVSLMIVDAAPGPVTLSSEYGCNYFWEPIPELGEHKIMDIFTTVDGKRPTGEAVKRYKEKVGKQDDVVSMLQQMDLLLTQFKHKQLGWRLLEWPEVEILWNRIARSVDPQERIVMFEGGKIIHYKKLISCVPLCIFNKIMGNDYDMSYRPIFVSVFRKPIDTDWMTVDYRGDPNDHVYRTTSFGTYIQYESLEKHMEFDLEGFQVTEKRMLWPGKIYPDIHSRGIRNGIVENGEITTVGRYASWMGDLLLHGSAVYARNLATDIERHLYG